MVSKPRIEHRLNTYEEGDGRRDCQQASVFVRVFIRVHSVAKEIPSALEVELPRLRKLAQGARLRPRHPSWMGRVTSLLEGGPSRNRGAFSPGRYDRRARSRRRWGSVRAR